ncbi:unnamed protein product [Urochloa humidicola]
MRSRVLLLVLWSLAMVVVALLWKGGQADAYYYYVPTLAVRCHPRQPPAPRGISWATKDKVQQANYFGSLTQASTSC